MGTQNISVEDLFNVIVEVNDSNSNPKALAWLKAEGGPLIGRNDINNLLQSEGQEAGIINYVDLKTRFEELRNLHSSGNQIFLNGFQVGTDKESTKEFHKKLTAWEKSLDDLYLAKVGVNNLQTGFLDQMIPAQKPSKRARTANVTTSIRDLTKKRQDAELKTLDKILGTEDNALQIGWMSFGSENAGQNSVRLGPDKVTIADFNNVSSVESVRSDTDVAIKGPGGRALVEIDIIFPNVSAINGTIIDDKGSKKGAAGLRDLLGMLRMSPLISVGGSAIATALINQITASDIYEDLRRYYFQNKDKGSKTLLEDAAKELGPGLQVSFDSITEILKNERQTYDLFLSSLKKEDAKRKAQQAEAEEYQGSPPSTNALIESLDIHSILIPLVCTSVTLSTVRSAVGAVRVRLSFQKFFDPYSSANELAFYDENGDGTFDARKAYPLRKGVETVYLSPRRSQPTVKGNLEFRSNPHYIPRIGDTTSGGSDLTYAGLARNETRPRWKLNEEGFMTYAPVTASTVFADDSEYSPIMFRFATVKNSTQTLEYIPSRMILEGITWHYANKIAAFPMEGQIYPGFQYMGRANVNATLKFSTNSRKAIQKFFTVKAAMDQHSTTKAASELLRREYCDIYNDILSLTGVNRWIISAAKFETDPDNPGLFHLHVEITSNMESVQEREKLVHYTDRASDRTFKAFWWWLYAGLVIKFNQTLNKQRDRMVNPIGMNAYQGSRSGEKGVAKTWTRDAYRGNYTETFRQILNGNYGWEDSVGAAERYSSQFTPRAYGDIAVSNPDEWTQFETGNNPNASHTQEEIETIWDLVFGTPKDSRSSYNRGIIEENVFLAAFLEMFRNGQVTIPAAKSTEIFAGSFNADPSGTLGEINNPNYLLSKSFASSLASAKNTLFDGGVTTNKEDPQEALAQMDTVIRNLANYYSRKSSGQEASWQRTATAWWLSNPMHEVGKRGTPFWLNAIADHIEDGADDSTDFWKVMIKDNLMGTRWIPSAGMWQSILDVISNVYKFAKEPGSEYSYELETTDLGGQSPFRLTSEMRTTKIEVGQLLVDPRNRRLFPSFWKKVGTKDTDFISKINPYGGTAYDPEVYRIDPNRFELNNNYIDLPMPRYHEIFGKELVAGKPPIPAKYPNNSSGYEVWRKVAPSYLELGIKPDTYSSLSILTSPDEVSIKFPELMTPRSFFDYCDPGYFYFHRSWLLEQYREIIDSIDFRVDETKELSPTGGNDQNMTMSAKNAQDRKHLERGGRSDDSGEIVIARPDHVHENLIRPGTSVVTSGGRTVAHKGEVDWGPMSSRYARLTEKEIVTQAKDPSIGKNEDLEQLYRLQQNKLPRVWVIDSTGKRVGVIISAKKSKRRGNMTVLKDIDRLVRSKYQINSEAEDSAFYFIDLSDHVAKTPGGVVYGDHAGVLQQNIYKDQDAKKLYKDTLQNMGDLSSNHMRAYPTFKLYFVREKTEDNVLITYLEDDMYGYHSVISLDLTIDKEDAAVANIVVTDISGVLSTAQFKGDEYFIEEKEPKDVDHPEALKQFGPGSYRDDGVDKVKLEVGTNIMLKMGYGNNPDTLKTVFTGSIAEIQNGPITNIVAQGFKTELFRQVNFWSTDDLTSLIMDQVLGKDQLSSVGSSYLTFRILQELATTDGVSSHKSAGGIPHIGQFISLGRYLRSNQDLRDRFTGVRGDDERDHGNRLSKIAGFSAVAAGAGLAVLSRGKLQKVGGALAVAAGADLVGGFSSRALRFLQKYDAEFMQQNAMRNVMFGTDPIADNWMDHISQEWLVDGDGWNALKEVTRYRVGYSCQVVPYGSTATLFIGKPNQSYHHKPLTGREKAKFKQAVPFTQISSFARIYRDVYSKFFTSPEWGIDTVRTQWTNFVRNGAAYRDPNESTINTTGSLESFVNEAISDIKDFKLDNPKTTIDAVSMNRSFDWLSNMSVFPSFAITRYIVSRLRRELDAGTTKESSAQVNTINISKALSRTGYSQRTFLGIETGDEEDYGEITYTGNFEDNFILIHPSARLIGGGGESGADEAVEEAKKAFATRPGRVPDASTFRKYGYSPGSGKREYWATYTDGSLVPKSTLENKFHINPSTGRPTIGSANENPRGNISNERNTYFATTLGIGEFVPEGGTSLNGNVSRAFDDRAKFNAYEGLTNALETIEGLSDHLILYQDHSEDLKYLEKFGDTLTKTLFGVFFGITWSKVDDETISYMGFAKEVESVWKEYTQVVMEGIGPNANDPTDIRVDLAALWNRLQDPETGVLRDIANSNLDWGHINVPSQTIDSQDLSTAVKLFESELGELVINGKVSNTELPRVQAKFRQFVQLAAAGQLASVFMHNVDNPEGIANAAKEFSTFDLDVTDTDERIAAYSSLVDKIMSQDNDVQLDEVLRRAFTVLMQRDPEQNLFDPKNINDLIILRNRLTDLNLSAESIQNIKGLTTKEKEALIASLENIPVKENSRKLDDAAAYNLISQATGGALDFKELGEAAVANTPTGIAFGLTDRQSMYEIFLSNADYYKLFVMFFVKWLKKESNADTTLRRMRVDTAVNNTIGKDMEPGTKRFQDTHYIFSGVDIIENSITATMSEMANNILLMTPSELEVQAQNDENSPKPIWKVDQANTRYIPYPNYTYTGKDWNPYVRPELRKQRVVIERNAETDSQRLSLLINHMAEAIRPMYRGHLKIIGRNVKPYDKIVLVDGNKDMFGVIEVERVIQTFNANEGWITTIIPCAWVNPLDHSAQLLNQFDTSNITYALKFMKGLDWVLDAWFIAGLILAPFSGGTTAAATAATGAAAEGAIKKGFFTFFKGMVSKQLGKAATATAKLGKGLAGAVNKEGAAGLGAILAAARGSLGAGSQIAWQSLVKNGAFGLSKYIVTGGGYYGGAMLSQQALKWGASMAINVATENVLRSTTLPIHTYCLTRFGRPIQAGLDMHVTSWYSWSERFGHSVKAMTDSVGEFLDEALEFNLDELREISELDKTLEGR